MNDLYEFDPASKLGDIAAAAGIQSVEMVAWRDLEHPEAGGSEVHAARIAERWAAGGISVSLTASRAPGANRSATLDGYRIHRPAGRYSIFPHVGAARMRRGRTRPDATVEIWNGMPFFSPVWAREPRIAFLHHVHGDMWGTVMPAPLAAVGKFIERRVAPPLYRNTPIVTLSDSSRQAIVDSLRIPAHQVSVVPPGVDTQFRPGHARSPEPLVVAVGRLVPYKRFDLLVDTLIRARERVPNLRAVIAGEGSERMRLEALIAHHGAGDWLSLPGRVDDDELVDLYQRSWLLLSTSAYEGWGLTITEAAACATPAVVSPIAGHRDALADGISGHLAEPGPEMEGRVVALLTEPLALRRLRRGALAHSRDYTWDRTALEALRVLADEAERTRHRRSR